jgi:hypothetical protein
MEQRLRATILPVPMALKKDFEKKLNILELQITEVKAD